MLGESDIAGTPHRLRYDFNALVALEEAVGEPLDAVIAQLKTAPSLRLMRALVWAGLRRDGVAIEQAGDIIGEIGMSPIADAVGRALQSALPKGAPSENPRERTARGT